MTAFGPALGQAETGQGTESVSGTWGKFDPIGDVALRKGDITAWSVTYGTDVVRLAMRLRLGTRVSDWSALGPHACQLPESFSCRQVVWRLDVDGDPVTDYTVLGDRNGAFIGVLCHRPVFRRTEPSVYVMRILLECIGSPSFIRARVEMHWSNGQQTRFSLDKAPAAGWSPRVTPS